MFEKIKALFGGSSKGRGKSEDLLRQAMLARDMMGAVRRAMKTDSPVLIEVHLPGGRHIFSVPGGHEGMKWLYDMAAGTWHACLTESRELDEKEKQEAINKSVGDRKTIKREGADCDYDRAE
jgi:hypothetical protein